MMSAPVIKLTRGVPPPESFPVAQLQECARAVLEKDSSVVLQYGTGRGYAPLRSQIAAQADVADTQVIIGQGSLQLQDFCARMLLGPGALAFVEEPTYDRALTVLRRSGAEVRGFPLEADGVDVAAIEASLAAGARPGLMYLIPDFQNPGGTVLSLAKRRRLAELAAQYGFWIVEDVPYRRLRYSGAELPSMLDLAPEHVLQMSSFSKLISPGLRVGYVIAPEALAGKLAKYAEDTYINASFFNQGIISNFISRGWLETNIAGLCDLYAPRLAAMLAALDAQMAGLATWHRPEGGFFVGVTLNRPVSADELLARGRAAGLELTDGRGFFISGRGDTFVRLPFCALTPDEISEGVARLAGVVAGL